MSKWIKKSNGLWVPSSYIKRIDYGPSGRPLLQVRRPYNGPWALATGSPYMQEEHYAFYSDGTEAGSVIVGSADNQQTLQTGLIYFARFCIANTGNYGIKNLALAFEYNHNSGGWNDITTSSTVVLAVDSANVATGDDCTARLVGTGTFHADNDGVCEDGVTCGGSNLDVTNGYYFNCLLVFKVQGAYVANGDEVTIRPVVLGGTPLDGYTHPNGADIDVYKPTTARRIFIT